MVRMSFLFAVLISIITATSSVKAATLFEGYYKILLNGSHVGYTINRYSFDDKKKEFKSVYFLKTNKEAGDMTESVIAVADENLNPISFEYTNVVGKAVKTVDAKVKKGKISGTIKENGKVTKISGQVNQGVFISNFLTYLILKSKDGLKPNSTYNYEAIAEEDGMIYQGKTSIDSPTKFMGLDVYKAQNNFKNSGFVSYITTRGEVISVEMTGTGIKTELVANPDEATQGQTVSHGIIKALFGDIPAGISNPISAKQPVAPSKSMGVPAGNNIQIKTEPTSEK